MPRPRDVLREAGFRAQNARDALRGYRFARRLPPANAGAAADAPPKGVLERYFDAHTEGPGIWKWRHYFDIYERHLARFVGRDVHVVEVGIYSGGSLPMWREYFGAGCRLYGVDIEPVCRAYEDDAVRVFIGDQGDPEFWAGFRHAVPTVDILIDDGGHSAALQIATLEAMLPHIRRGGVYLCEDVHGAFHPFHAFVDGLARPLHAIGAPEAPGPPNALHQHVASVHRYPLVTVIEKPPGPVRAFEAPKRGTEWQPFL
jgi:hypothetical protein